MKHLSYSESYIFDDIHKNFPNLTITLVTKSEQEINWFCITILQMECPVYTLIQVLIESDWNTKWYCLKNASRDKHFKTFSFLSFLRSIFIPCSALKISCFTNLILTQTRAPPPI